MASGDDYRIKAADVNARARREASPQMRIELRNLALAYLRLADQADRNANLGSLTERARPQVQQQQQPQAQPQPKIRTGGDDTE
jgi:hypothetical protein